jgi:Family of unknown function (DUF695)/Regulator of ribonuclease activity B
VKKSILAFFAAMFCTAATAQQEQWDTYVAKFGDKPGSVLVDMGLYSSAPDHHFPYLIITGPIAHKCDKHGIPDKDEIPSLEDILNSTGNFLNGVTAKVLVGTFTCNCERMNYYYAKDTLGVRTAMRRMYDRNYKDHDYAINIKYDPEWKSYLTFLYPDEATQNWMQNNRLIQDMNRDGSDPKKPRAISFDFYFSSDTGRTSFEHFATSAGYTIAKRSENKGGQITYALAVAKTEGLNLDEINRETAKFREEAAKHGGAFLGWSARSNGK